jgi:thiamine biosynthesis lipoprotein
VGGADLGVADAYSTAALAMGMGGLDWLSRNSSYESAVVTDDGLCFHSEQLPVVLSPAEPGPDPG